MEHQKHFSNKFRGLLKEFKTKLESERKQFVAKGKKLEKKAKRDNLMSFRKMLKEGDVMNDLRYFNRCMSLKEQKVAMGRDGSVLSLSHVWTNHIASVFWMHPFHHKSKQ